ncbi:serine/threonine protein kinase [Mycobacterium asiaticum]|uniref:non-specific serine/threonine protein kinase n=1 Tax=Mycobacterium asiaticum TaxID=1790 RepID=A0A1A3P5I8_MYCAS|nr:serine/threonine-protein kinase PknH/PknJ [Mycobacterium asiaticum]OBK28559.1 serine/threonine protein kinase [Mycobacterium asiaticum]
MTDTVPNSRAGMQFGPYRLRRLLGRGGMGEVYEAVDTVKERTIALKLLSQQYTSDAVFRRRMQREAHTAGRLQEPHIVPIHDFGEIDGQLFIDMRFIEGEDLGALLKRAGALPPPRAVAIITQIAAALDAAHRAEVIHRDIKPENVLITGDDFAYLVDFGIAAAATDQQLTKTGTAVGSWRYMAPERFADDETTYRSDIYSLACVLYECLAGRPPYQAQNLSALMAAHLMHPVPRPSEARQDIPRAFDEVIARGMAKEPAGRYATAGELARAAKQALSAPDQDRATTMIAHSQQFAPPPSGPIPRSTPTPPGAWNTVPPATPQWVPNTPPSGPPARKRWPIVAALVSVVTLLSATGIWLAVGKDDGQAAANTTPTNGLTTTATTAAVTTTPPSPTVAPGQLESLLLSTDQLNTMLGTTGMVVDHNSTETTDPGPQNSLSDERCLGALIGYQARSYKSSGYTAMLAQLALKPNSNPGYVVVQGAVVFASAELADAFVTAQDSQWRACAGRTITQTNEGKTSGWAFRDVMGSPPKISLLRDRPNGRSELVCQHVLSAVANIVIDVNVCAPGTTDQAIQIADAMAAKVPK